MDAINKNTLPPPEELFLGLPPGIRSELLIKFAQAIESGTDPFKNLNLGNLPIPVRWDFIIDSLNTGKELSQPYRRAASEIASQTQEYVTKAQNFEKAGEPEQSIIFYEQSIAAGFLASLPYERLRVMYTKQKKYEKAIRVCKRYIEILNMVETFWSQYPNIRQIPKYQEEIKKLNAKLKTTK